MNTDPARSLPAIAKYGLVVLMLFLFVYVAYFLNTNKNDLQNIPVLKDLAVYNSVLSAVPDNTLMFPEVKVNADAWYSRVVLPGEVNATVWVNENTNTTDKFVSDIWGAELIMGMTMRVSTVGGDWANAPDPVKYMSDTDTIYISDDPGLAYALAKENNCSYVWLPNRDTFSCARWVYGNHQKFDDGHYFRLVYNNSDVSIYKVL